MEEKTRQIEEGEAVLKKSVIESENVQLIWFFAIIVIVFAAVLIPYFWIESSKSFEYGGADWVIENYDELEIFHGRFAALSGANLFYNVYLRGDPRENNIATSGSFDKFKHGGIISVSPEVDACRGELSRIMLDLGAFLRQGVGVGIVEAGSTDKSVALESNRKFGLCNTASDRTIVIVKFGEAKVVQNESYPYCYTIYAENCNDIRGVEKFMLETINNFNVTSEEK